MTQLLLTRPRRPALAPLALGALSAALIALPSPGAAQDDDGTTGTNNNSSGGVSIKILSIGGENQNTVGDVWIGLDACQNNAEVEFRLDNVPDREVFDIYVGSACNTTAARDQEGDDCELVRPGVEITVTQDLRIRIGAGDIIEAADENVEGCGSASSKPNLWFLAVDNSGTSEAVDSDDYGRLVLNVDTDPPDAPTRIRGGRGENEIPVTWSNGSEEVDSFEIYVDSGEGTGEPPSDASVPPSDPDAGGDAGTQAGSGQTNSECGTGALREGATADSVSGYFATSEGSPTATSTELSSANIEGRVAAVAVVAIDEAGNKSTLSEVACVYVVPTTGLKDLVEQNNGEYPQGCPCAATGPAQLDAAWPIGLALTALAYRRRKRS